MIDRPLLCLVMIVKDEARSIETTLQSVRPFVDRWLILDTGSTDGTQDLAKKAMDGLPGQLVEEPFVDFGSTRSRALELAGTECEYSLMLSGDEALVGGEALRAFAEANRGESGPKHGAYHVQIHMGDAVYDQARLARTDAGWRYLGVTHEHLGKEKTPPPTIRVPDCYVLHDVSHRDPKAMRRRWELDLKLLTAQQKKTPQDHRTQFYLAQTLECLGEHRRAAQAYERRVKMGGWPEEVYESMFRLARTMGASGARWSEVEAQYLAAHTYAPHRAEPLHEVAVHWYKKKNWPLTYLFAKRGSELPFPKKVTNLVDREVYAWKLADLVGTAAYYVGEYEAGERALAQCIAARPDDERFQKNLAFYQARTTPKES